jgi:hypothetical protein
MVKEYIGDGIYATYDKGVLILTTEDRVSVQNQIVFESTELMSLFRFIDRIAERNIVDNLSKDRQEYLF